MKAREALIAWSGLDDPEPFKGKVLVGRVVDEGQVDWSDPYVSSSGASFPARRALRGADTLVGLFRDFQYLVVEERLDPEVVHSAFLAIDEYAELFSTESVAQDREGR